MLPATNSLTVSALVSLKLWVRVSVTLRVACVTLGSILVGVTATRRTPPWRLPCMTGNAMQLPLPLDMRTDVLNVKLMNFLRTDGGKLLLWLLWV